jgi:hypothetical protein
VDGGRLTHEMRASLPRPVIAGFLQQNLPEADMGAASFRCNERHNFRSKM